MTYQRSRLILVLVSIFGLCIFLAATWNIVAGQSLSDVSAVHDGGNGSTIGFFPHLFKVYMPRRVCMAYETPVIWLHLVSDLLIALAYYSIPVALLVFVRRRRDMAFKWIFWLFAAFILACGTTHVFAVIDLWRPFYKIDGIIKLITALISVFTAAVLWPLIPQALSIPSRDDLEREVAERTDQLRRSNAAERAARADAERTARLKDEFLATLSHELRTPLNAILGWSQLLNRQAKEDDTLKEGLSVIERNSRLQAQLIEDLLDMSAILSGKIRMDVQQVNIADVVNAAIESMRPTADAKTVSIETEVDTRIGEIRGDAARLHQILWNLLSNAVKFTPAGGKVRVALKRIDRHVEISVSDTGAGISPEFLPHVFERFRQADASTTRRFGGLGLGLAIVKHLVELHGGSVRASSPGLGLGATFIVELPLMVYKDERVEAVDHPRSSDFNAVTELAEADALSGVSVLVVDDEADARQLFSRVLGDCKAQVTVAASAADALELVKQNSYDVILSDIGMPDEDGYEFIRRVRMLPSDQGGHTPAAALTAFARSEDRMRALRAGYQSHIAKPVEPGELITVVASLSGKSRPWRG